MTSGINDPWPVVTHISVPLGTLQKLEAQISGGLCYFSAESKHCQLQDAMKTLQSLKPEKK